jgi:hypothetical protein
MTITPNMDQAIENLIQDLGLNFSGPADLKRIRFSHAVFNHLAELNSAVLTDGIGSTRMREDGTIFVR